MITYNHKLNMTPGGIPTRCKLGQYDDDWTIVFSLYSAAGEFTLESGTYAMIRGTKRDGLGYSANCTVNVSNKTVTVTGHKQITAVAGENIFEIVLYKGTKELSSTNVVFYVERAAMDAGTLVSDSQVQEILDMSEDVIAASDNVSGVRGNFAPAYSTSSTYSVGDYVMYSNQMYRCTTAISTAEAWTPAHWTAVSTGGEIVGVKSTLTEHASDISTVENDCAKLADSIENLSGLNSMDLIKAYGTLENVTKGGVTFTWDANKEVCTLTGKRTAAAFNAVFLASGGMHCFTPGETYYFAIASSSISTVYVKLFFTYTGGTSEQLDLKQASGTFTIPANAVGITVRINCDISTSVASINETISFRILNAPSNHDLNRDLTTLSGTVTGLDSALTGLLRTETGIGNPYFAPWSVQLNESDKFSLLDMPQNTIAYTTFSNIVSSEVSDFPYDDLTAIYIEKYGRGNFSVYRIFANNTDKAVIGYYASNAFHWYALPRLQDISAVDSKVTAITRTETGVTTNKDYSPWTVQLNENNKFSLLDMPQNTIAYTLFSYLLDTETANFPFSDFSGIYVEKIGRGNFNLYRIYGNNNERYAIGFYSSGAFYWYARPTVKRVKIGMLGDSVTKGVIGNSGTVTDKGIPYWVNYETGQPVVNLGVGSMGWISKQHLPSMNAEEYIQTLDLTGYDVLTLQYGLNDGDIPLGTYQDTTEQTIMGAVYRVIDYIYTQNSTVQVIIINPTVGSKTNTFPYFNPDLHHAASDRWTFTEYFAQMRLFCEKYAIPLIDGYKGMNAWNRASFIEGNVHPTETGYRVLGRYIAGQIKSMI